MIRLTNASSALHACVVAKLQMDQPGAVTMTFKYAICLIAQSEPFIGDKI